MSEKSEKDQILQLIAEGYFERCHDDRFIVCQNPNFQPDNGSDEYVVFDTQEPEQQTFDARWEHEEVE